MNIEKVREVLSDEDFTKKLFELDDTQEVKEALKSKGLDLSIEEIVETHHILNRYLNNELNEKELESFHYYQSLENEELSDLELESVNGGSYTFFTACLIYAAICTVCFGTVGASVTHVATRGRW